MNIKFILHILIVTTTSNRKRKYTETKKGNIIKKTSSSNIDLDKLDEDITNFLGSIKNEGVLNVGYQLENIKKEDECKSNLEEFLIFIKNHFLASTKSNNTQMKKVYKFHFEIKKKRLKIFNYQSRTQKCQRKVRDFVHYIELCIEKNRTILTNKNEKIEESDKKVDFEKNNVDMITEIEKFLDICEKDPVKCKEFIDEFMIFFYENFNLINNNHDYHVSYPCGNDIKNESIPLYKDQAYISSSSFLKKQIIKFDTCSKTFTSIIVYETKNELFLFFLKNFRLSYSDSLFHFTKKNHIQTMIPWNSKENISARCTVEKNSVNKIYITKSIFFMIGDKEIQMHTLNYNELKGNYNLISRLCIIKKLYEMSRDKILFSSGCISEINDEFEGIRKKLDLIQTFIFEFYDHMMSVEDKKNNSDSLETEKVYRNFNANLTKFSELKNTITNIKNIVFLRANYKILRIKIEKHIRKFLIYFETVFYQIIFDLLRALNINKNDIDLKYILRTTKLLEYYNEKYYEYKNIKDEGKSTYGSLWSEKCEKELIL